MYEDDSSAAHLKEARCLIVYSIGLLLVARSELEIVSQSAKRPRTSSSSYSNSLSQLIPPLLTAIEHEDPLTEDAFQAQVCLGWVHWVLGEPGLALSRIPNNLGRIFSLLSKDGGEPSGWTQVCAVKGAYIRGWCSG